MNNKARKIENFTSPTIILTLLIITFILFIIYLYKNKYQLWGWQLGCNSNNKKEEMNNSLLSSSKTKKQKNILILYYVTYCGHCKKLFPTWNKLKKQLKNKVIFIDINGEKKQNICKRDSVNAFPTIRLIKNGEIIDYNGDRSYKDLLNFAKL